MVGWCCLASVGLTGSTDPATKSYRARRTGWASEVTASRSGSWSAAEAAIADLLTALGQDLDDDHIRDTPGRAAAAYAEMLTPRRFNPTNGDKNTRTKTHDRGDQSMRQPLCVADQRSDERPDAASRPIRPANGQDAIQTPLGGLLTIDAMITE